MQSRVLVNSYTYVHIHEHKVSDCINETLNEGDMLWCFPLLKKERRLVSLKFTKVDPQKFMVRLLLLDIISKT
jgi:hypothetical protein